MTELTADDRNRLTSTTFLKRVEYFPTLVSTNDHALRLTAEPHLETPLIVIAREQTAGRGRGSNHWWSADGALTFSIVIEPALLDLAQNLWPRVAVVTGMTLCDAIQRIAPQLNTGLKWPNDVWLNQKKVAGILVEVPPAAYPIPPRLVIGIGINLNNTWKNAPLEIRDKGTTLADLLEKKVLPGEILVDLMQRFEHNLRLLAHAPQLLAPRWQSLSVLTGKIVEIRQGDRLIKGSCTGIAEDGGLMLENGSVSTTIYGGTVVSHE